MDENDNHSEGFINRDDRFPIDFREIWLIVRRNKLLIISIITLALAVGLLITMLTTPQYVATASVQIDQEAARVLDNEQDVQPAANYQDTDRFLQTQIDVLQSRAMAVRVAQRLKLFANADQFLSRMQAPELNPSVNHDRAARAAVLGLIEENVEATLPRSSRVVSISFTSPDPTLAAQIANIYADEFIKNNLQRKFDSTAYARNFLSQQLAQAKQRLEQSERALNAYAREAGLINTNKNTLSDGDSADPASITQAGLVQLNRSANAATADRIAAEAKWRNTQNNDLLSIPDVLDNGAIQGLLDQRATVSAQLDDELARHRDAYPTVIQLRARLAQINDQIRSIASSIKNSIKERYDAALASENALRDQVNQLKNDTLSEQDRSVRYNILAREADTNRTLYDGLLQRYKEVSAASGITANNISLVDEADIPGSPTTPRLMLNLALALLAGIVLAGGVVFVREQLDDAIRGPEDIDRKLGISTLGVIPVSEPEMLLENLENPRSDLAEAYNSLRTSMLYATADGLPPIIHMTSTGPGEGKSTTSYALASSFAKLGKKALLIDVDLRRPALHQMLSQPIGPGLSDLLTSDRDIDSVLRKTDTDGMFAITSGPIPPSPTELLGHPRLIETLDQLKQMFDVIILDGPPVLGLADAPLLASIIGNTVFVVEANRGHRGSAKTAIRRLHTGRAHVVGAVLTKFDPDKTASAYGYYGYDYYRYGNDEA
tara:strand:- start:550 stop:2712 length:2163 start_codon:yes stop_codon:yes gene_type:complete